MSLQLIQLVIGPCSNKRGKKQLENMWCVWIPEIGLDSFRCVFSSLIHSLSRNSNADRISPSMPLQSWKVWSSCSKVSQPTREIRSTAQPNFFFGGGWCFFCTSESSMVKLLPRKTTLTDFGFRGQRMETAVMTPKVPSEPMNSCLRSYPVLSFRSADKQSSTWPSANT